MPLDTSCSLTSSNIRPISSPASALSKSLRNISIPLTQPVSPDADIVTDSHGIEPSDPFLSDELPVSDKTIHTLISEQYSEPFYKFFALGPFGVASFGHKAEYQRDCYSLIGYSKHEDIDVEVTELPFVLSMLSTSLSLTGSSENIILAIRSRFNAY